MKKILTIAVAVALCSTAFAQVPKEMKATPLSFMFSKLAKSKASEAGIPYIRFTVSGQKNNSDLKNILNDLALSEKLKVKVTKVNESSVQLFKVTAEAPVNGTVFCSQTAPQKEIVCAKGKNSFPLESYRKTGHVLMIYSWSF